MTRAVRRPRKFQLRLTEEEEERWREAAGRGGLSEFIRQAVEEKLEARGGSPAPWPAAIAAREAAGPVAAPALDPVVAARERLDQIAEGRATRPHAPRCTCRLCQVERA